MIIKLNPEVVYVFFKMSEFRCEEVDETGRRCDSIFATVRGLRSHVLRIHHRVYSTCSPSVALEGAELVMRLETERRRQCPHHFFASYEKRKGRKSTTQGILASRPPRDG